MPNDWERRRMLIWGKTRPEISNTHKETVCTGGVFADARSFVRLYPIPLRFLTEENTFRKYQWIEADIQRANDRDPRPESYRLRPDSIRLFENIPARRGNWDDRAEWVLNENTMFQSVEELQKRREEDHTSIGIVKPAEILDIREFEVSQEDRDRYWERYEIASRQHELAFDAARQREIRPLGPPDYRFKIRFRCDDERCPVHYMSVLDWEIDALYHRQLAEKLVPDLAAEDVVNHIRGRICADDVETRFYLGNMSRWHHVFAIVGLWYPKRKDTSGGEQGYLFDEG